MGGEPDNNFDVTLVNFVSRYTVVGKQQIPVEEIIFDISAIVCEDDKMW